VEFVFQIQNPNFNCFTKKTEKGIFELSRNLKENFGPDILSWKSVLFEYGGDFFNHIGISAEIADRVNRNWILI
jgi:hypothetical protein